MDLAELKPHLDVYGSELRQNSISILLGAYDYLEKRVTGDCEISYYCRHSYEVCELARLWDPSFVSEHAE